jgi:Mg2+/Co2+ transporter CorB
MVLNFFNDNILLFKWLGIGLCLVQSGIFSGLNLGLFGISRLGLEVKSQNGDQDASRILNLRKNAHFLLATILWGNVGSNVLLTLISDSFLAGTTAFIISTFGITFFGEIIPQAYLSRTALKSSRFLVPVVRFYQVLLFFIARPTGYLLDLWLGKENTEYFNEDEFIVLLREHAKASDSNVDQLESKGAINFLKLDDIMVKEEGEIIEDTNIIRLRTDKSGNLIFPPVSSIENNNFINRVCSSIQEWIILIDKNNRPKLVLNSLQLLKKIRCNPDTVNNIRKFCIKPFVIEDKNLKLESVLKHINRIIILWTADEKRIITSLDLIEPLLKDITKT